MAQRFNTATTEHDGNKLTSWGRWAVGYHYRLTLARAWGDLASYTNGEGNRA